MVPRTVAFWHLPDLATERLVCFNAIDNFELRFTS